MNEQFAVRFAAWIRGSKVWRVCGEDSYVRFIRPVMNNELKSVQLRWVLWANVTIV